MARLPMLLAAALLAGATGGAARPQAAPAPARSASPESPHLEWGYTGPTGPDHWAELSQEYGVCARGQQESPIDLRQAVAADLGRLATHWRPLPLRVVDTGHALQVDSPAGSDMSLAGRSYVLAQFHIHHPSEHLLNGRRFPLEIHFVHRGQGGVLGVVGVFVEEGRTNPELQRVLDARPAGHGQTRAVAGGVVNIAALLPGGAFHRYEGSLTTPPCSENVDWVVMARPIQASAAQIAAFERVYPFNARPLQALNRRFLLRSR